MTLVKPIVFTFLKILCNLVFMKKFYLQISVDINKISKSIQYIN